VTEIKSLPFDSELRKFVLSALSDEYSKKILNYTIEQPRSVIDIVKALDIPMTTAYRRINSLTEQKILKVTGSIVTDDGKKYFLYKSRIKSINVVFGLDSLDVQIVENKDL
jgi:predicted transcriptional regulator